MAYRKMSRGMKLKLAIELSELVLKLRKVRWAKPTLHNFGEEVLKALLLSHPCPKIRILAKNR